jgi:NDP-sugar pyrophosphorylase family protein
MSYPITAVVLAGGLGTRLRSIVADRPKCLAEVNERPFIFYVLDQLITAKVDQIILAVNYMGDLVQSVVGNSYRGMPIDYSWDTIDNGGTGHAVRAALPIITHGTVFILNGDTYINMPLRNFIYATDSSIRFCINVWNGITNMGMYCMKRKFIERIIFRGRPYSLEKSFLADVYADEEVLPFLTCSPFIDIGTPESYLHANEFMSSVV